MSTALENEIAERLEREARKWKAERTVEDTLLGNPHLGRFIGWVRVDFPANDNLLTNLAIRTITADGIATYGVSKVTGEPERIFI